MKETLTLVYKNINSFIQKHWDGCVVWERKDRGLQWLTQHGDWHIQTPTSSCFFDGSFDTELVLNQGSICNPLANVSTHWLLSEWLITWLSGVKNLSYYIFCRCLHSSFWRNSHGFIFAVPLFTLRHRCNILLWNHK